MTTIEIHYQSPESDPLKVPRPHRAVVQPDGVVSVDGSSGEIGPVGNLIGFSLTTTPGYSFRAPQFFWHRDILNRSFDLSVLRGYYAQFSGEHGDMFGYTQKIDRVVVN